MYLAFDESAPHDESRLPHMYSAEKIEQLFPIIEAAPEQPNVHDYVDERQRHDDHDDGRHDDHDGGRRRRCELGALPQKREQADPPRRFSSPAGNG